MANDDHSQQAPLPKLKRDLPPRDKTGLWDLQTEDLVDTEGPTPPPPTQR